MTKPLILAVVHSDAIRQALDTLDDYDMRYESIPADAGAEVVARFADAQPALILVELSEEMRWLSFVRSDPATRRFSALAIAADDNMRRFAMSVRMNCVSVEQFLETCEALISANVRIRQEVPELASQCEERPSALLLEGIREFNAGKYFAAHETLEHAWMAELRPIRDLYRVILQISVGYYHITQGNYQGARKMFLRAAQWFAPLPEKCMGVDVAGLHADSSAVRDHLEALGAAGIEQFDRSLLKPVRCDYL